MSEPFKILDKTRSKLHEVIFEADTLTGKIFDVAIIVCIFWSIVIVSLDSVDSLKSAYGPVFVTFEWFFTFLFTIEYFLRIASVKRPIKYIFSFYGLVDLLAIVPSYLSLILVGSQFFLVIRSLRVLRIFRIFKLVQYIQEAKDLWNALKSGRRKITIFLFAVISVEIILGSIMYLVEDSEAGFTSIPRSIYWAIVTLTTVGYGDIAPRTGFGQLVASVIMMLGYSIIAVPLGLATAELRSRGLLTVDQTSTQVCPYCCAEGHETGSKFCKDCGKSLN
ncbi:MAG: voltage-gated potassium channel [Candidatus Marinamargulisbacteria bacterium]|jgi:voltage-gated potassium channel